MREELWQAGLNQGGENTMSRVVSDFGPQVTPHGVRGIIMGGGVKHFHLKLPFYVHNSYIGRPVRATTSRRYHSCGARVPDALPGYSCP
jgi:hypothetical protein